MQVKQDLLVKVLCSFKSIQCSNCSEIPGFSTSKICLLRPDNVQTHSAPMERKGCAPGHVRRTECLLSIVSIVVMAPCPAHKNLTFHTGNSGQNFEAIPCSCFNCC